MKKILNRIISIVVVAAMVIILCPNNAKAATTCIIRAPFAGTVIVNGKTLTDADMCDYGYMDGRIQRIAVSNYNVVYKYKDYQVTVDSLEQIQVFDANKQPLKYTVRNGAVLDYTSNSNEAFVNAVNDRVKNTAIAFHNRVGGYGAGTFNTYFKAGTDAHTKCVNSDGGRKWGQYMRAQTIKSIVVSDLFIYSPDVFSARVDIQASGTGAENYSVYFLFKNVNGTFYPTHFTYQD